MRHQTQLCCSLGMWTKQYAVDNLLAKHLLITLGEAQVATSSRPLSSIQYATVLSVSSVLTDAAHGLYLQIEKKPYYNIFKVAGFVGFDGDFQK